MSGRIVKAQLNLLEITQIGVDVVLANGGTICGEATAISVTIKEKHLCVRFFQPHGQMTADKTRCAGD